MARIKQYDESEVLEKAMHLFWQHGYENTSTRMLEQEMGINQFSIYSSFGSKQDLFVESIKAYKRQLNSIRNVLLESGNGVAGIKQFFYNFLDFTKEKDVRKGCFVCNTVSEMGTKAKPELMVELMKFTEEIRILFLNNLQQEKHKTDKTAEREANFLMTCMLGLSLGSRVLNQQQLEDYIETIFKSV
jgi:TetR/AcrR family transcriptional repressor of nem operon